VVEHGSVIDIYQSPTQDYTRNLLLAIPGRKHVAELRA